MCSRKKVKIDLVLGGERHQNLPDSGPPIGRMKMHELGFTAKTADGNVDTIQAGTGHDSYIEVRARSHRFMEWAVSTSVESVERSCGILRSVIFRKRKKMALITIKTTSRTMVESARRNPMRPGARS